MKNVELTLGCIMRNEGHHIAEWLVHHHLVGFDRFVCVLHQCVDNTEEELNRVKERLGLDVFVHHCKTEGKVQMGSYQWMMEQYGARTEWLLYLDADEFVYCTTPSITYSNDLKDYLRKLRSASAVAVNNKVFGPNRNIIRPASRLTAYTERLPFTEIASRSIKTFIRTSQFVHVMSPHYQQVDGLTVRFNDKTFTVADGCRSLEEPIWEPVCFNHYYTGSVEDWVARYRRGSCNDLRPNHAYSVDEFLYHTHNMEYDDAILKYQGWHQALMEQLSC